MKGQINFGLLNDFQEDELFEKLEKLETKIRTFFVATGVENAAEVFDSSINMGEILGALPANQRNALLNEYANIIDFDANLKRALKITSDHGKVLGLKRYKTSDTRMMGRFNVDLAPDASGKLNPLSVLYNRMTLNQHYITGDWRPGRNILKSSYLRGLTEPIRFEPGKAGILVFDTETAGLGKGHVREIAAFRVQADTAEDGRTIISSPTKETFKRHLRTAPMKLGSIADHKTGVVRTLEEVLQSQMKFKYAAETTGSGEVFAKVFGDFLEQILDPDIQFISGQNLQFDIDQLFISAKQTGQYKQDAKFRGLVKKAEAHVQGRIIDTLELSRIKLPGLEISKEVRFSGAFTSHSMENILLQTNLSQLIMEDMGENNFLKLIGATEGIGSVHSAVVDTRIEAYLLKYLIEEDDQGKSALRTLHKKETIDPRVRGAIRRSAAPTPVTNAAHIGQVPEHILRRMFEPGEDGLPRHLIEIMNNKGEARDAFRFYNGNFEEMVARLTGSDPRMARFKINPIEIRAAQERKLGIKVGKRASPIGGGNAFADFSRADIKGDGFLNKGGELANRGILPGHEEYAAFQQRAAAQGDILAGLSLPERMVTEGMHRASLTDIRVGQLMPVAERQATELMGDLGASYFELNKQAVVHPSGGLTLPVELLKSAEEAGELTGTNIRGLEGSRLQTARVSVFQQANGTYRANLAIDLTKENVQGVLKYLNEIGAKDRRRLLGRVDDETVALIMAGLNSLTEGSGIKGRYAIAIGQVSDKAAEAMHAVMAPFSNSKQISSDLTEMTFNTSLFNTDGGIARVGAFVSHKVMTEGEKDQYSQMVRRSFKRQAKIADMAAAGDLRTASLVNGIRVSMGGAGREMGEALSKRAAEAAQAVQAVTKRLPLIGVVLAGALATKMGYTSLKERNKISETFDFQGYEGTNNYYNIQQQVESQRDAARYIDPLSTAGVVGNLSGNARNHTIMGPGKNNHLFAGVM